MQRSIKTVTLPVPLGVKRCGSSLLHTITLYTIAARSQPQSTDPDQNESELERRTDESTP